MKKQKIISDFKEFVSIQSVSTDPKRFSEILSASDFLSGKLKSLGFKTRLIGNGKSPPLVIASIKSENLKAKTIGIYGHYDVQPEDPIDEWKTPPFKLTLKNGRFFGRGVSDDKGQVMQNIAAVGNLIESGKLKNNIVFVIEGEEESDGGHFEGFVKNAAKEISKADCIYVADTEMHDRNTPRIFYTLRGLIYFEIKLQVGKSDFHSGTWGNSVINPAQVLSELLAEMKSSKSGRVNITGFYDDVRKIGAKEGMLLSKGFSESKDLKDSGAFGMSYLDQKRPWLSAKAYPSMDIDGIISGYTGEGSKTIIPRIASAKFSFRLVRHQNPAKVERLVRRFIERKIPKGVKCDLKTLSCDAPFLTSLDNPYVRKTAEAMKIVFGKEPLFSMDGGIIAAAEVLNRVFAKPIILTGFANPDCHIHAPNENLEEYCFWKGIEAFERIYSQV
jgi:acetylornithine deacetylase/succinyl-diaminopimelate desuccinylase-like protein